jgi:hypothetical protein
MWTRELQELSEEYFEYDGTHVKNHQGKFGILRVDSKNRVYTIFIKPSLVESLIFKSIPDMIKSGWVVD